METNQTAVASRAATKNAITIGFVSILAYVINYYLRNLLSVLNPYLLETGNYTIEFLATLSSTYMICYAAGQLFNGVLGDLLSPKLMVSVGTGIGGLAVCLFPFCSVAPLQIACFAVLGYALSMVRGPLMKIISESTKPNHARQICVFFSFASFSGPLIASIFAMLFKWNYAFIAAGAVGIFCAILEFVVFSYLEKKDVVRYRSMKEHSLKAIFGVFKIEKFAFYLIIACLVEICAASISFWIPTFLSEGLGFETEVANLIFSGISICRAMMPFVALFIFRLIKENDIGMMRVGFIVAASMFFLMIFVKSQWLCIAVLLLALLAMSCISALLWSIYIPGLGKTGRVSSINGVLDCSGYVAAAGANIVFAFVATNLGWSGLYGVWAGIAAFGLVSTFFVRKKKNEISEEA